MIEKIIKDLEEKLNLNIDKEKLTYYSDGATESIVFNIDNKYLVKTMDDNTLKTQIEYLSIYSEINRLQKVVTYNEELGYICFEFIDGLKFSNINDIDVMDIIDQIYGIVSNYKEYNYDSYGYLYEDHKSWYDFLKDEVDYSKNAIKELNINIDRVYKELDNIKKYDIKKYLIHGDFGVHNFILSNGEVKVIDPMPVVGDRLYDFYFSLFSSTRLFSVLKESTILDYFEGDIEYKKSLMFVVLFIRMCRCYVYHKEDFDTYLTWFNNDKNSDEISFHKDIIAFVVYNNEIKYLKDSMLSYEAWCDTLGIDKVSFNKLIRGYIMNNEIIYYQGDFEYNEEVINTCVDTYETIAKDNNLVNYSVYCGVVKGKVGEIWKPILKVK